MSLSLNKFSVLFAVWLAIVFVSKPRTLHSGSESISVMKLELVFCPWVAVLEGETVANPPCPLPHKGSPCKEEAGWEVLRHQSLAKKGHFKQERGNDFLCFKTKTLLILSLSYDLWHLINKCLWYSFHTSKSTLWLSVMCCWRMLNTPFWLDCTIPFRQQTNYTLSWILSMVEKWVLFVVVKLTSALSHLKSHCLAD